VRAIGFIHDGEALDEIIYDSDPSGGAHIGARAELHACASFGPREGCTVTPGDICYACFDETRDDLVDLCAAP
jgi:hypothetical protein